ncbi:2-hexaprenyl-6-methoxy-1,4-benzoquinone methyltransferase [Xanthoria parietina]
MPPRITASAPSPFQKLLITRQPYRCLSCSIRLSQSQSESAPQPQNASSQPTTHFGFEEIPSSSKSSRVSSVFSSVASSYDTMNDLMSLGIHRLWKDHFVRSLNPGSKPLLPASSTSQEPRTEPWTMLDIAGGTGDIAFRLLAHASLLNNDHTSRVIVSDINPAMLSAGRTRAQQPQYAPYAPRLEWLEANAESLPPSIIKDNSIDLYTVAFGIRNFTSPLKALREAYRVLKPGGVFACLEFSKVENRVLDAVYKRWSFGAIPIIGQLVAGDRDSYQYLVESIERFPRQREWRDRISEAGFLVPGVDERGEGGWENLTGGVAAIHKGIKPLNGG